MTCVPSHSHSALQYVGRTCSERDERTSKCSITTASSRRSACLLAPHAKHRQRQQSERLAPHNRYAAHSCHSADAASPRTDRNTYDSDDDNTHNSLHIFRLQAQFCTMAHENYTIKQFKRSKKVASHSILNPETLPQPVKTPIIQSILSY